MGAASQRNRFLTCSLLAPAVAALLISGCGNQDAGTVDLTAKPAATTAPVETKGSGKMQQRSLDIGGGGANGPTSAPAR